MTENCNCNETIEREIWTRSYLRAIDVENPRAAAAAAEEAIALYRARWKTSSESHEEVVSDERRYKNSVDGARLASSVRYRIR